MKSSKSLTIKTDISSDKKKEIFIKSYVELIKKLKFNNISPQEAHDLVIKNKFQFCFQNFRFERNWNDRIRTISNGHVDHFQRKC